MKLTQKIRAFAGITMLLSAASLVVTFVVLACKKRSLMKALLALAVAQGVAGACLLADNDEDGYVLPDGTGVDDEQDEVFTAEETVAANAHIRSVLHGKGGDNVPASPRMRREVPRDEEATEADFAKEL